MTGSSALQRPGPDDGEPPPERRPLDVVRFAATLLSAAIILLGLYYGQDILIPLAIAFLIGFALSPPVQWLVRVGLPRLLAVTVVMAIVIAILSGLGLVLTAQVRALAVDLPTYQSTILDKLSGLRQAIATPGPLDRAIETVGKVQTEVAEVAEAAGGSGNGAEASARQRVQRVEMVAPTGTPLGRAAAWLGRAVEPLAVAGIVLVFSFLVLLDRGDLRDRMLRLLGDNVHRSTDSIEEAGARVSRYLLMQVLVNVSYGVPMSLGLWLIGVPGALLWGVVATVMRFVPYVGPMISAVFPLALAFAVDDGWNMLLWTAALIVFLELVSNNIIEPMLYGSSTGLSTLSLIGAALFWTALWGPAGLILSTPMTVCLLVLGRNLPQLSVLDILLGSTPVLDLPTRIYQRLIADDAGEAVEIACDAVEESSPAAFYNETGMQVLRLASADYLRNARAAHRMRFATGMDELLAELTETWPPPPPAAGAQRRIVCIGGKWDIDAFAAAMVAHSLALEGLVAEALPASTMSARYVANLDLRGDEIVCLGYLSDDPRLPARHFARRLRLRWPELDIVVGAWNVPPRLLDELDPQRMHADAIVVTIEEALRRIHRIADPEGARQSQLPERPADDAARVRALRHSRLLDAGQRSLLDAVAKRAADIFDTDIAVVTAIDQDSERFVGQSGRWPADVIDESGFLRPVARRDAICDHVVANGQTLVVPDIERDPRFADGMLVRQWGVRFYAGTALRAADDSVLGALCILDDQPRALDEAEVALLETMASDLMAALDDDETNGSRR
ncbi:MAG: AI-2E family transporter [Burkholderiaceae bacterium]